MKPRMRPRREEESHQVALTGWFRLRYPQFKDLLFIIANGENVGPRRMDRLKQMGLVPGMPDLMLAVTTNQWPGLFIEMKSRKGFIKVHQENIHILLSNQTYKVVVSYGWDTARKEIEKYLNSGV